MSSQKTKSLAVVIPTLRRPVLRDALSALAYQQESQDFFCVVVHGPEITEAEIRSLVPPSSCMCLETVSVHERSVGARRNAGAAAVSSHHLAFTDDDCRVPPGWIACLKRFSDENPHVDIAGGAVVEPMRGGPIYSFMRRINYMANSQTMKVRPGGIPSLGAANLWVRRAAFERLGGFDPTLVTTEDYELLVRAQKNNLQIGTYLEDPPVEHWHGTPLRVFINRYRGYGRGVAQTVMRHGLDGPGHRLDGEMRSLRSRLHGILRFAREDLLRHPPLNSETFWARCGIHGVLAVLRAYAFQKGALEVLRTKGELRGS